MSIQSTRLVIDNGGTIIDLGEQPGNLTANEFSISALNCINRMFYLGDAMPTHGTSEVGQVVTHTYTFLQPLTLRPAAGV